MSTGIPLPSSSTVTVLSKLIDTHKNSGKVVRIEFNGTETQCKAINKTQFKGTDIDIKMKYSEIYENEIAEPSKIIEKYSKDQILGSFKDFCEDKDYDYKEGSSMIKEFLNK